MGSGDIPDDIGQMPACPVQPAAAVPSSPMHTTAVAPPTGGAVCPVDHARNAGAVESTTAAASSSTSALQPSACPLGHVAHAASATVRADGQGVQLSRDRVTSSIPSASGDPFMYPSESQFYHSASAKGHTVDPQDMSTVVSIHNAVNERAWHDILRYEELHAAVCSTPKLMRFVGRPGDLSLKARLLGFTGRSAPFDRHDWFVDRCGTPVRYVVDFYDGKQSPTRSISIFIDARPEVSWSGLVDRFRLWARDLRIF